MTEHPNEAAESGQTQHKQRLQLPRWVGGLVLGEIFWGLMALGSQLVDAFGGVFPEWFDLPNFVGSICSFLAYPIAVGGWVLIWQDDGPPFRWIDSHAFNIGFGLVFYGFLGILAGPWVAKRCLD